MRHGYFGRKLSRNTNERKRLLLGLAQQLIKFGNITTTLPKAKAVQPMVEKMITKSKKGKGWAATRFPNRTSGYTRIVKLGTRLGDSAQEAMLSFVDPLPEVKREKPKAVKIKPKMKTKPVAKKPVKKSYARKNKTNKSK